METGLGSSVSPQDWNLLGKKHPCSFILDLKTNMNNKQEAHGIKLARIYAHYSSAKFYCATRLHDTWPILIK